MTSCRPAPRARALPCGDGPQGLARASGRLCGGRTAPLLHPRRARPGAGVWARGASARLGNSDWASSATSPRRPRRWCRSSIWLRPQHAEGDQPSAQGLPTQPVRPDQRLTLTPGGSYLSPEAGRGPSAASGHRAPPRRARSAPRLTVSTLARLRASKSWASWATSPHLDAALAVSSAARSAFSTASAGSVEASSVAFALSASVSAESQSTRASGAMVVRRGSSPPHRPAEVSLRLSSSIFGDQVPQACETSRASCEFLNRGSYVRIVSGALISRGSAAATRSLRQGGFERQERPERLVDGLRIGESAGQVGVQRSEQSAGLARASRETSTRCARPIVSVEVTLWEPTRTSLLHTSSAGPPRLAAR